MKRAYTSPVCGKNSHLPTSVRGEAASGARLRQLCAAFAEFDATAIDEQLRKNEPATLGRTKYSQGVDTRYQGIAAGESTAKVSEWQPWVPGTRTHARFTEIVEATGGAEAAAPVNPRADMPGVLILNNAALRKDPD